jgi:hypothetical protein
MEKKSEVEAYVWKIGFQIIGLTAYASAMLVPSQGGGDCLAMS